MAMASSPPASPSTSVPILAAAAVAVAFSTLYAGLLDVLLLVFFSLLRQRDSIANHLSASLPSLSASLSRAGFPPAGFPPAGFLPFPAGFLCSPAPALLVALLAAWLARALLPGPAGSSSSSRPWDGPGRVLLFPCRTTHARTFPKKHSFAYSYLAVGIPVGFEGCAGGMVSVGAGSGSRSGMVSAGSGGGGGGKRGERGRTGWFDVDAADYLDRGGRELGLRGKLDAYLCGQGADPNTYPYAYLVTAARFLGYHFNPVSFWYLYNADKSLAAMILEVNNTFGERRMYFLKPDDPESPLVAGARQTLKQSWPKDFHVSPFNSRKGSYTLTAHDPLSPRMQGTGPVNNTISLVSSKGHGKLVARLIPDGPALDPYSMTAYGTLKFLASWWWVGFLTFPRIVKEAGMLFFRRNLHVWFRPEPLKDSIGREADATERELEVIFRKYLRHLVGQSASPIAVKYVSAGISKDVTELMLSPSARDKTDAVVEEMEFKVLTPVFYSRFVYYAHDLEALFCELQESCTIWVSRPDLLPKFALKKPSPTLVSSSYLEFARFKLIQGIRRRPERIERPLTSSASSSPAKPTATDIRGFRISSMDGYVLSHETRRARTVYARCVLKLFLADRFSLGFVPLLEAQRFLLQTGFAWLLSSTTAQVWVGLAELVGEKNMNRATG